MCMLSQVKRSGQVTERGTNGLCVSKGSREEAAVNIPGRMSSVVRGFARSGVVAAGAIFLVLALAAQSTAGDVSGFERRT